MLISAQQIAQYSNGTVLQDATTFEHRPLERQMR